MFQTRRGKGVPFCELEELVKVIHVLLLCWTAQWVFQKTSWYFVNSLLKSACLGAFFPSVTSILLYPARGAI